MITITNPDEDNIWNPNLGTFPIRSCDAVVQCEKSYGRNIEIVLSKIEQQINVAKCPDVTFEFNEIDENKDDPV